MKNMRDINLVAAGTTAVLILAFITGLSVIILCPYVIGWAVVGLVAWLITMTVFREVRSGLLEKEIFKLNDRLTEAANHGDRETVKKIRNEMDELREYQMRRARSKW